MIPALYVLCISILFFSLILFFFTRRAKPVSSTSHSNLGRPPLLPVPAAASIGDALWTLHVRARFPDCNNFEIQSRTSNKFMANDLRNFHPLLIPANPQNGTFLSDKTLGDAWELQYITNPDFFHAVHERHNIPCLFNPFLEQSAYDVINDVRPQQSAEL